MHSHSRTLIAKLGFADPDKKSPRHDLACQYLGEPEQIAKIAKLLWPNLRGDYIESPDIALISRATIEDLRFEVAGGAVRLLGRQRGENIVKEYDAIVRRAFEADVEYPPRVWISDIGESEFEQPVEKGTGQYRTVVGFLDTVANVAISGHGELSAHRWRNTGAKLLDVLDKKPTAPSYETNVVSFSQRERPALIGRKTIVVEVKIAPVAAADILRQVNFYRSFVDADRWVAATDFDLDSRGGEMLTSQGVLHVRLGRGLDEYIAAGGVQTRAVSPTV